MFPNLRLLFPRFFLVAQEINYPFCCSVYYEIKQRKIASNLVVLSITQQTRRVSVCALLSFVETSENNTKKFVGKTEQNLYAVGRTGWFIDLFTNHSKPSSIGQKHSHCLANYSNSVVIGYPGRKLPWKLLTIVYKGEASP